jgi:protein-S-isoprenylcysteine O-methyltransferase Ste14
MPEHPHQSMTSHEPGPAGSSRRGALARPGLAADRPEQADPGPSANRGADHRLQLRHRLALASHAPRTGWLTRIAVNLAGATIAALFAQASLRFYLDTHRLIGGLFVIEQTFFAVMFLLRRPAEAISRRPGAWLLAFGGTFGGLLLRPGGAHPPWGVQTGFIFQLAGLLIAITSLLALGRSFGFVAADRGLKTRGPYAVVRHPVYASYLLIQSGYLLQSLSPRNALVVVLATACNIGRALAEETLLARSPAYQSYQEQVRWRLIPYLW